MKIVVLEIYHYDFNSRVKKVDVEVFKTKESCKQFINKFFEDINMENNIISTYNDGFIVNEYEDYFYTVDEKILK